jgi:hypothetical protein
MNQAVGMVDVEVDFGVVVELPDVHCGLLLHC